jgi:hypothetical protein
MGQVLMQEASDKAGRTVDSVAMIMDVQGVGWAHFTGSVKNVRITPKPS